MQAHPYYTAWPNSGNYCLTDYYHDIAEVIKPDVFNALLFTVFGNGHDGFIFDFIHELRRGNVQVYGGSEWPEGLDANTPRAINAGMRGLLTGPTHPYLRRTRVEPWMVDAVKRSHDKFVEARQ